MGNCWRKSKDCVTESMDMVDAWVDEEEQKMRTKQRRRRSDNGSNSGSKMSEESEDPQQSDNDRTNKMVKFTIKIKDKNAVVKIDGRRHVISSGQTLDLHVGNGMRLVIRPDGMTLQGNGQKIEYNSKGSFQVVAGPNGLTIRNY